jgi:hypothetical protein
LEAGRSGHSDGDQTPAHLEVLRLGFTRVFCIPVKSGRFRWFRHWIASGAYTPTCWPASVPRLAASPHTIVEMTYAPPRPLAVTTMLQQIVANNRAAGWRRLTALSEQADARR